MPVVSGGMGHSLSMESKMSKIAGDLDDATRKKKLIAEGEFFRVGIMHAKSQVAHALQPKELLHDAVQHAVSFATSRVENMLSPSGMRLQTIMPYVLTVFSFLKGKPGKEGKRSKRLLKPGLVLGTVASAAIALVLRRRAAQHANDHY
jgi:hypothetical protein